MNKKLIFITGGARSGKSSFAEKIIKETGSKVAYLATAIAFDEEMRERIKAHKERRPENWITFEEPKKPAQIIKREGHKFDALLLDCLTIMISNLMISDREINWEKINREGIRELELEIEKEVKDLLEVLKNFKGTSIIVSNELGMGIVPPTPLGRIFRDVAGKMNQIVADEADEVYLVVSGIPVKIKG